MSKIFFSGLLATSLMTLFSYLLAYFTSRQFREPQLLNILLKRSGKINFSPGKSHPAGWLIHYSIGWVFVFIFDLIWSSTALEPTLASGCLLGFFFGLIGVAGWKFFLTISRDPPEIDRKAFFIQLIPAHIIFGFGAVLLYL